MTRRLYHVSEEPGIAVFEPRLPGDHNPLRPSRPVVWAVEERLLHNYLLPRECPRVTFHARPDSDPDDVRRLMGATAAAYVVAVEGAWLKRIRETTLYLYEFSASVFEILDGGAGYCISYRSVYPLAVHRVDDLLDALVTRGVELRLTPSLWPLRDAVLASTLQFSFIRMRNARP